MAWNLDNSRSIYLQLMDEIRRRIISGEYPPGSRMASVRELADEAGVNPNTMQKALSEMERQNLVFSRRTSGRFVTDDTERIREMRKEQAMEAARQFVAQMEAYGFSGDEIIELLALVKGGEQDG